MSGFLSFSLGTKVLKKLHLSQNESWKEKKDKSWDNTLFKWAHWSVNKNCIHPRVAVAAIMKILKTLKLLSIENFWDLILQHSHVPTFGTSGLLCLCIFHSAIIFSSCEIFELIHLARINLEKALKSVDVSVPTVEPYRRLCRRIRRRKLRRRRQKRTCRPSSWQSSVWNLHRVVVVLHEEGGAQRKIQRPRR